MGLVALLSTLLQPLVYLPGAGWNLGHTEALLGPFFKLLPCFFHPSVPVCYKCALSTAPLFSIFTEGSFVARAMRPLVLPAGFHCVELATAGGRRDCGDRRVPHPGPRWVGLLVMLS